LSDSRHPTFDLPVVRPKPDVNKVFKFPGNKLLARPPSGLVLRCLGLSHEILIEPGDGAADGVNLVLAFHEAVTFIRIIVNIYDPAFFLEDVYDLLRLLLGNARVVVALKH
jgi:hypothetical protein